MCEIVKSRPTTYEITSQIAFPPWANEPRNPPDCHDFTPTSKSPRAAITQACSLSPTDRESMAPGEGAAYRETIVPPQYRDFGPKGMSAPNHQLLTMLKDGRTCVKYEPV